MPASGQVLIRPNQRSLTLNDILHRLAGVKNIIFIDMHSGYLNVKLDEQSSYLAAFFCPFSRYIYIQLLFSIAQAGDMFHRKIDELCQGLPNVFGIDGHILIAGFYKIGREHDATLNKVLKICIQTNLKFSKDKCLLRCTNITFFGEVIL